MVKIKYQGLRPVRHRIIRGRTISISPGTTIDVSEEDAKVLLSKGAAFQLADSKISKIDSVPEPKTLSKSSKTVDVCNKYDSETCQCEKEKTPEEQKPEKKEKVLKAKPKAKKPNRLKKDKLRKKLASKRKKR